VALVALAEQLLVAVVLVVVVVAMVLVTLETHLLPAQVRETAVAMDILHLPLVVVVVLMLMELPQ
jgi:hypothetical protein